MEEGRLDLGAVVAVGDVAAMEEGRLDWGAAERERGWEPLWLLGTRPPWREAGWTWEPPWLKLPGAIVEDLGPLWEKQGHRGREAGGHRGRAEAAMEGSEAVMEAIGHRG